LGKKIDFYLEDIGSNQLEPSKHQLELQAESDSNQLESSKHQRNKPRFSKVFR
jgi:hypothetical protein